MLRRERGVKQTARQARRAHGAVCRRRTPAWRCLTLLAIALCLLMPLAGALAAEESFSVGDMGDEVLRAQLRLNDLGYADNGATGIWRRSDARALAAFYAAAGKDAALFFEDAPRKAIEGTEEAARPTGTRGGLMPWSEVQTRLKSGTSYTLTDYNTGIVIHLRYLEGEGEGYARMQPTQMWDSATMSGLFEGEKSIEARPAVIVIDGLLVAASFRLDPLGQEKSPLMVQLYFAGSVSGLGGLADEGHNAAMRLAAAN